MDDKKTLDELDQVFSAGDAWLRKYGIVSDIQHNAIVLNLYMNFPKAPYVEYYITKPPAKKIHVIMHFKLRHLIFTNRDRLVSDVIDVLRNYLPEHSITVELKRYKKGAQDAKANPPDGFAEPTE